MILGDLVHSFQGSFFSGNHQKPTGNSSRFLKKTMVEKNGEATPRVMLTTMGKYGSDCFWGVCNMSQSCRKRSLHTPLITYPTISMYVTRPAGSLHPPRCITSLHTSQNKTAWLVACALVPLRRVCFCWTYQRRVSESTCRELALQKKNSWSR